MLKERILIALISIPLIYCAGSLALIFWLIYTKGVVLIEPNKVVILSEFCVASLFTLLGLGSLIYMIWSFLKYCRGVKDDS